MPFLKEAAIDVVVAGEVIEHMSNPGEFLEAAYKALRPQGRLILSTVNVWCFLYYAFEVANTYRANFVHVCWYDRWTLTNLLNNHRFVIKKLWYYGFPKGSGLRLSHILYVFLIRWPASVLGRLPFLRRFVSPGVVVVCEKASQLTATTEPGGSKATSYSARLFRHFA